MNGADAIAVTALSTVLSLVGLVVLYWLYQDYRMDLFRQRLFTLRDEVFDIVRAGDLSFDHPAYGLLRSTLNGFIRFAHRFSLITVIWAAMDLSEDRLEAAGVPGFKESWEAATRDLDPRVRAKLGSVLSRMHLLVADQLVFTSPVLMGLLLPVLLVEVARRGGKSLTRAVRQSRFWKAIRANVIDPVDSAALVEGSC